MARVDCIFLAERSVGPGRQPAASGPLDFVKGRFQAVKLVLVEAHIEDVAPGAEANMYSGLAAVPRFCTRRLVWFKPGLTSARGEVKEEKKSLNELYMKLNCIGSFLLGVT